VIATSDAGTDLIAPDAQSRLADALRRDFGQNALAIVRLAKGMGTVNWLVQTPGGEYFLKQYPADADLAAEAAALELSQSARAVGIPAPLVLPARDGRLLWSDGELALALFEYVPDTTSGVALNREQMAQSGRTLGRLHSHLRPVPATYPDITDEWLALDAASKRVRLEEHLRLIERREVQDDFDRRTIALLHRRIELLPHIVSLLASLPPLTRQVLHGDYSVWNVLFRGNDVAAVVDFRPPERFLASFEIGRAALNPETLAAGSSLEQWLGHAVAFIEEYCAANPRIPADDVRYAPHVWASQLVRSEYGVRQHYVAPLEYQDDLDRFWFLRCEAAEHILGHLAEVSAAFVSAWERRNG
jgi:fructosamine-3-kinase